MPKFLYYKQGDAVGGAVHRIFAENEVPWLLKRYDGKWQLAEEATFETNAIAGLTPEDAREIRKKHEDAGEIFKFKQVEFADWTITDDWEVSEKGIEDPVWGLLDRHTGEPIG